MPCFSCISFLGVCPRGVQRHCEGEGHLAVAHSGLGELVRLPHAPRVAGPVQPRVGRGRLRRAPGRERRLLHHNKHRPDSQPGQNEVQFSTELPYKTCSEQRS